MGRQQKPGPRALRKPGDAIDIDVRTEADRVLSLDGFSGVPAEDPRLRTTKLQVEAGLLIPLPFEGGGMLARFRLGAPDQREDKAWVARAEGWLDLSGGLLGYGSSDGPPVEVPPGEYRVEVGCHLSHPWGQFLLGREMGDRKFQEFLRRAAPALEGELVEVVVRLTELTGRHPVLRLDRTGLAREDVWQVRMPASVPVGIPVASKVHYGGKG